MSTPHDPPDEHLDPARQVDDDDARQALEDLERATLAIAARSEYEQTNRRGLLWVHAIVALLVGVQILVYGGPVNVEASAGVWTRPALGLLALGGGLLLAAGLLSRPRNLRFEAIGLVAVGAWDLAMTAGLIAARAQYVVETGQLGPRPLLEVQPPGYVVPYAIAVYGGLLALLVIHLLTIRKLAQHNRHLWIRV